MERRSIHVEDLNETFYFRKEGGLLIEEDPFPDPAPGIKSECCGAEVIEIEYQDYVCLECEETCDIENEPAKTLSDWHEVAADE